MQLPKIEVKKILYATDLSDNARYAFAYALSLAVWLICTAASS